MKDPALMTRWERTYWMVRLRTQLLLGGTTRWVKHHLLGVPRDEATEEWLNSMSEAELDEFLMLAEQIDKRVATLQTPQPQPVTLGRSIFDHKSCGRFLDQQLTRRARPTGR